MGLGVIFSADKPRTKLQVPGLERAKVAFDEGQVFVTIMDRLRVGLRGLEIRLHGMAAVLLRGGLERGRVEGQAQPSLADAQLQPVLHLEACEPGHQAAVLVGDFGPGMLRQV
jgi:hypothetical protein